MRYYDFSYLISPELSEKEVKDFSQEILGFIKKEEGVLYQKKEPIKIKLAYPIKKMEAAYFGTFNFSLDPGKIQLFQEKLKSNKKLLRFLIISQRIPKTKLAEKIKKPLRKPKKVELSEIETKLDEILKES